MDININSLFDDVKRMNKRQVIRQYQIFNIIYYIESFILVSLSSS